MKRGPHLAAAITAVLVALVVREWFDRASAHRPTLERGQRYGIDISSHQGDIDWPRVAGDGIGFAYIKATEGADFVDARFAANWRGAADAGVDRGAYHFFTLCRPGVEQADNFLRTASHDLSAQAHLKAKALAPAVDLELAGNCSSRPDRASFIHELTVFVDAIEAATGKASSSISVTTSTRCIASARRFVGPSGSAVFGARPSPPTGSSGRPMIRRSSPE